MALLDECHTLWSLKKLRSEHLESSQHRQEFADISAVLGITSPRQILWHAMHAQPIPRCACGNQLSWHQDRREYRTYCSKRCTAVYSQSKIKATNIKRRGVSHHTQTQSYRDKVKQTSLARFGNTHYSKTEQYKHRVIATNQARFSVDYPAQDAAIRDKIRQTTFDNHGVHNPMHNPVLKAKQAATNLDRYGKSNPLSSDTIKAKVAATMIERYGHRHAMQVPAIADAAGTKRKLNHYTAYAYEKIHDRDWLAAQNQSGKSIGEIADELGVSSSNLCKYFHEHGLDIKKHFRSAMERDIAEHLAQLDVHIVCNDRRVISPLEIDIWIPSAQLGIELNGAYYHSELQGKRQRYHLNKTNAAAEAGIDLLQFFDWEVFAKRPIILDKIHHALGLHRSIGARKLTLARVNKQAAWRFFEDNHLQGACAASTTLGLYDEKDQLLAAMSFGKSRYSSKYQHELLRFCCALGVSVPGAASRLLKNFMHDDASRGQKIVSYCNRRWSNGGMYERLGFTLSHTTPPGYYYIQRNGQYAGTRQQWQKHLLRDKLPIFDQNLSEADNMLANGYTRVWDCGQLVYEITT
jgi:AraC-like DNA-binding protein